MVDIVKDLGQVAVYLKIETDTDIDVKLNNRNNDTRRILATAVYEFLKDETTIIRLLIVNAGIANATVTITARL